VAVSTSVYRVGPGIRDVDALAIIRYCDASGNVADFYAAHYRFRLRIGDHQFVGPLTDDVEAPRVRRDAQIDGAGILRHRGQREAHGEKCKAQHHCSRIVRT